MVGIVGLGWIIVDLSRYKIKEEKKGILGGVDVMIKIFMSSRIQYLYTYIPSIAAKVVIHKGVLQLHRQRH